MRANNENRDRLPGSAFPLGLTPTASMSAALGDADIVLLAVPSGATEATAAEAALHTRAGVPAVVCAKGLAKDGALLSQRVGEYWKSGPVLMLSGPSFADEVAAGLPTIVTLAGPMPLAAYVAAQMSDGCFVVSPSKDIVGTQVAGVFKNVVATLCGVSDGLGLGANARAALMSEGMREAATLIVKLDGSTDTLLGPAGFGDFALTCTDSKSRNYRFGHCLAKQGAGAHAGATREGAANVDALMRLASRADIDVPLAEAVAGLVAGRIDARAAVAAAFNWRHDQGSQMARTG
jgi:glycerol-3-phosphate dehydrogenase (NAD(P)+)